MPAEFCSVRSRSCGYRIGIPRMTQRRFNAYDTVRFVNDTPAGAALSGSIRSHASKDEIGVVIEVYSRPHEGYEVEIMDLSGRTLALVTTEASNIEFVAAPAWQFPVGHIRLLRDALRNLGATAATQRAKWSDYFSATDALAEDLEDALTLIPTDAAFLHASERSMLETLAQSARRAATTASDHDMDDLEALNRAEWTQVRADASRASDALRHLWIRLRSQ